MLDLTKLSVSKTSSDLKGQGAWGMHSLYQDVLHQAVVLTCLKVNYSLNGQECKVNTYFYIFLHCSCGFHKHVYKWRFSLICPRSWFAYQ